MAFACNVLQCNVQSLASMQIVGVLAAIKAHKTKQIKTNKKDYPHNIRDPINVDVQISIDVSSLSNPPKPFLLSAGMSKPRISVITLGRLYNGFRWLYGHG